VLDKVISGGQTGADQAGLRAARAAGIPTGGWAPLGWRTEGPIDPECGEVMRDVSAPWLADFGLVECPEPGYKARTGANVRDSDGTLWFGNVYTPGGAATLDACRQMGKPFLLIFRGASRPSEIVAWIGEKDIRTLNVAGDREGNDRGIGGRVEAFMTRVFARLGRG
jgi:hypothetical protein